MHRRPATAICRISLLYPVFLRYTHQLLVGIVLVGALLAVVGCGRSRSTKAASMPSLTAPRPLGAPADSVTEAQRQAFSDAAVLRLRGRDQEAFEAFKQYVLRFPASALTDQALLALGDLATKLGDTVRAEGYYRSLLQHFTASPLTGEAYLRLGILGYEKQDYAASLAALRQALRTAPLPQHQTAAYYHIGLAERRQKQYGAAIEAFKTVVETSADSALGQEAQRQIHAIIHDDLFLEELQELAHTYSATYPGALILNRLAQHYRDTHNVMEEMATLQRLVTAFPHHPDVPMAQMRLRQLQLSLSTNPTKIGVLLPLSGDAQLAGQLTLWGVELALATWREQHPDLDLTIVPRDTQGDSAVADYALRSLVNDDQVIAVIGPLLSPVATDLAPLIEELGIPVISPYARTSAFPYLSAYAFRNSLTDAMQGQFLAAYAIHVLNLTRFAVIYPNEPYGVELKDAFIEHAVALGGQVVAVSSYPPDTTDFRQPIRDIGGVDDQTLSDLLGTAGPPRALHHTAGNLYDAIFMPGYYDRIGLLAPALAFYNIDGLQLIGTDGWNDAEITKIGERFVEGAVFIDGFFAHSDVPAVRTFVERFQARYGEPPNLLAAQGYDTLLIVARILQEGVTRRDELRHHLLRLHNFPGVSGLTRFDAQGNAEKVPYLLTIKKGQIVQLN